MTTRTKTGKNLSALSTAQYKDSESTDNNICDTLAELCFPQKYDPTFLGLKKKEQQKIIHVNRTNENL